MPKPDITNTHTFGHVMEMALSSCGHTHLPQIFHECLLYPLQPPRVSAHSTHIRMQANSSSCALSLPCRSQQCVIVGSRS
jgi:hypothetical protein